MLVRIKRNNSPGGRGLVNAAVTPDPNEVSLDPGGDREEIIEPAFGLLTILSIGRGLVRLRSAVLAHVAFLRDWLRLTNPADAIRWHDADPMDNLEALSVCPKARPSIGSESDRRRAP